MSDINQIINKVGNWDIELKSWEEFCKNYEDNKPIAARLREGPKKEMKRVVKVNKKKHHIKRLKYECTVFFCEMQNGKTAIIKSRILNKQCGKLVDEYYNIEAHDWTDKALLSEREGKEKIVYIN